MGIIRNRICSHLPNDVWGPCFTKLEKQTLLELAQSRKAADRKRCQEWFRGGSFEPRNLPILLDLADVLILDPNPNIRWGVLVDLTKFAEDQPEKLWPLIIKWSSVYNPDIRMGTACCLLEHLLGYHFEEFFERSRQEILGGNRRFAATLNYCYKLGQAEEAQNACVFDDFLASLHLRQWK